jgi:plastocyanin
MVIKILPKRYLPHFLFFLLAMPTAYGSTTLVDGIYRVNESASFQVQNNGTSDFVFAWGSNPTYSGIFDPSLELYVGKSYTFSRTTSNHPFAITKNLPVTGTPGSLSTTSSSTSFFVYLPEVSGAFVSNPGGSDPISWAPTSAEIGTYHYVCTVSGHVSMVGQITVVPEPSTIGLLVVGLSALGLRQRSSPRN